MLGARFKIKAQVYLDKNTIIDHLGMNIFEDLTGVYLTMQSYIEVMTEKLGIDVTKGMSCKLPMSDDMTWSRAQRTRASYSCLPPALWAGCQQPVVPTQGCITRV